jgi:hypothetical protein
VEWHSLNVFDTATFHDGLLARERTCVGREAKECANFIRHAHNVPDYRSARCASH